MAWNAKSHRVIIEKRGRNIGLAKDNAARAAGKYRRIGGATRLSAAAAEGER